MGITNFQNYIKKTYNVAFNDRWLNEYDNLYVDCNYILHKVCCFSSNETDMMERMMDYVNNLIKIYVPKRKIILVADGQAPLAKFFNQRKRRIGSNTDLLSHCITVGTPFMKTLKKHLEGFAEYHKLQNNLEVVIITDSPGEGELKIKHTIDVAQTINPTETHIVYSNDSDTILLLFTCKYLNTVYQVICKECILNFGKMYESHCKIFGETHSTKYDFTFINLLLGNDYLPKIKHLTVDRLWQAYAIVARSRITGLVKYNATNIKIDPIFFHDTIYHATKHIKSSKHNVASDINSSKNYVVGMCWLMDTYIGGYCKDYQYTYHHTTPPHYHGIQMAIIGMHKYSNPLERKHTIDTNLYGILLIPKKSIHLLDQNQKLIARIINKKHKIYKSLLTNDKLNHIINDYMPYAVDTKINMLDNITPNSQSISHNIKYVPKNTIFFNKRLFTP